MNQTMNESPAKVPDSRSQKAAGAGFILGFHGVRYQVKDVSRSVAFYTRQLGFDVQMQHLRRRP